MVKRLLTNKRLLVVVVIAILIITGVIIALVINQGTKEPSKQGTNLETEKIEKTEQDESHEKGADEEEPYNGNGLEIKGDIDESIPTVDGSGSWDDSLKNTDKEDNNDDVKEDKEDKVDKEENILDNDGYNWTYPN